jgi:hypothetical protein
MIDLSRILLLNNPGGVFLVARFKDVLLLPRTTRNSIGFSFDFRAGRLWYIGRFP